MPIKHMCHEAPVRAKPLPSHHVTHTTFLFRHIAYMLPVGIHYHILVGLFESTARMFPLARSGRVVTCAGGWPSMSTSKSIIWRYQQARYSTSGITCCCSYLYTMIQSWIKSLWALLLLASVAQAQFQFFENMFGGGHQHERAQQETQNVPSDSSWYQKTWDGGESTHFFYASTL